MNEPGSEEENEEDAEPAAAPLVEGQDYYMQGPYLVFTEAYHRKRGYCCGSGCRHCPWRDPSDQAQTARV